METWWLCVFLLPLLCVRGEELNFVKQNTNDNDDASQEVEQDSGTSGDSIENVVTNSTEDVQPSSTVNKRDPSSSNKAADDAWKQGKGKHLTGWENDRGTVVTELKKVKGITTEELTEYEADINKKYDKLKTDMDAKTSLTADVLKDVKKRVDKSASRETPNVEQWQTRYLGATTIVTSNIKTLVTQVNNDDVWGALATGCSMLSGILALVPHPAGIFAATVLNIASFAFGLSGKTQADPYEKVYEKINQAVNKITLNNEKIEMARLMAPLEETNRISKRLIRRMGKQFTEKEFFYWALTNNFPRMDAFVQTLAEIKGFVKMLREELIKDNKHTFLLTTYAQISILRDTILTTLVAQLPDPPGKDGGNDLASLKKEYFDTLNEGRKAACEFLGELHKPTKTNLDYVSWYYRSRSDGDDSDRKLIHTYLKYLTYYKKDVEAKQEVIYTMPHAWTYDEIIMENAEFKIECENGKHLVSGDELVFFDKKKKACNDLGATPGLVNSDACAAEKNKEIGWELQCKDEGIWKNYHFKFSKSGSKYELRYFSSLKVLGQFRKVMFHEMEKKWKDDYSEAEGHDFKAYIEGDLKGRWSRYRVTKTKAFDIIPYNSDTNNPAADTLKIMLRGGNNRFAYHGEYSGRVTFQKYRSSTTSKFTLKIKNLEDIKKKLVEEYPDSNNVVNVKLNIHDILYALRFPDPPPPPSKN